MRPLLLAVDLPAALAGRLTALGMEPGVVEQRRFPDGESYLRLTSDCRDRHVVLGCSLNSPDEKLLPLLFSAATARELGAKSVGLVAPYLAYLRQDAAFAPGESVSARHFARLLSAHFDWLVTVDPHLHRLDSLDEVYTIPSRIARAAPAIAAWLQTHVARPLLIGPDEESRQWVGDIAQRLDAPCRILVKQRRGDRDVEVSMPELDGLRGHTPVIVDDIVSSGQTMLQTVRRLQAGGLAAAPICIAVHAIFADGGDGALLAAGAARVLTCNTVAHASNGIDVGEALAQQVAAALSLSRPSPPVMGGEGRVRGE